MEEMAKEVKEMMQEEKKEEIKGKKEKKKREKKEKTPMDKAKKKKIRRRILIAAAALVVVYMVVSSALAGSAPMPVTTVTAAKGEIEETISTSGTVTTGNVKTYFSDVNIKLGDVKVSAGDVVKSGDVLLTYDADDLNLQKQLAELKKQAGEGSYLNSVQNNNENISDLAEADVNLDVLEQQIADVEANINRLENKIADKKSELAHFGTLLQISLLDWQDKPDSDEYMNLQKMVQTNNYEQNNHEDIRKWQEELDACNDVLAEYKEYRSEMKSQQSSAEAGKMTGGAITELEANNASTGLEAQHNLDAIVSVENGIVADFDGVVTKVSVVNQSTPANGAELLTLESTEDVFVKIAVTKYDLEKIAVGQSAKVTIGSNTYEGEVSKINKMAEKNESGAAVVGSEIQILNPDSEVFLGVEAKVVISTAQESDAVVIPVGVVNVDMDGEFVYVVENNVLVKKRVTTGISSDTMVQIVDGVSEGEQLVSNVTTGLTEGMTVVAMPDAAAE